MRRIGSAIASQIAVSANRRLQTGSSSSGVVSAPVPAGATASAASVGAALRQPHRAPAASRPILSDEDGPHRTGSRAEWSAHDVAEAPSQCAFHERMQMVLQKLRGRLYSVYRPLDVCPADFEALLSGCERHREHAWAGSIVATFAAMSKQPLPPTAGEKMLVAWGDNEEKLSRCVRRAAKLMPPGDALSMIRKGVLCLPEPISNSDMCRNVLLTLQGQHPGTNEASLFAASSTSSAVALSAGGSIRRKVDLGVAAAVAAALVRQGDKDTAMEIAEAAIQYRLREGPETRDVETVAAECAEAAATLGSPELVARFSFVMFKACGALGVPARPSSATSFTEWWMKRLGRLTSLTAAAAPPPSPLDQFEASLTQVLASSIHATFIHADADRGLAEATALFSKLKGSASWDAHCAMANVIYAHVSEQHTGTPGEKTNQRQTVAVNLLASLADAYPAAAMPKQVESLAGCVVATMALFAAPSHVTAADGRTLKVQRALSALRLLELFARLPAGSTCRRRALPLLLSGCAGLGRWDVARTAVAAQFGAGAEDYHAVLGRLVRHANASADEEDLTLATLALHCELFNPDCQLPASALELSDDALLLLAHSLAISGTAKPAGKAVMGMLQQLAATRLHTAASAPLPVPCATELFSAALVHRHPSAATLREGHALFRLLLQASVGMPCGASDGPSSSTAEHRLLSSSSTLSFSADTGLLVGCGRRFDAVALVDVSAVTSSADLTQFLSTVDMIAAEAQRRCGCGTAGGVMVAFAWAALAEATVAFGSAFTAAWMASSNFFAVSPLMCPAACTEVQPEVSVLAAGLVSTAMPASSSEAQLDALRAQLFLWIESEGQALDAPAAMLVSEFHVLSRRRLSAAKALHDVRSLLGHKRDTPSLPKAQSTMQRGTATVAGSRKSGLEQQVVKPTTVLRASAVRNSSL